MTPKTPEQIARVAHEINRAYCEALGDSSQPKWEDAPQWQRDSAMLGVNLHTENPDAGPQASHESWMAQKVADGWVYGPEKNPDLKQHPCLVPFDQLPREQQAKDFLFRGVVGSIIADLADAVTALRSRLTAEAPRVQAASSSSSEQAAPAGQGIQEIIQADPDLSRWVQDPEAWAVAGCRADTGGGAAVSNFTCEHCGANICDSPHGYVTGCEHYPMICVELAALAKDQEPLGAEFEAVWDAHVDEMYEP